jgi:hypothetical protein
LDFTASSEFEATKQTGGIFWSEISWDCIGAQVSSGVLKSCWLAAILLMSTTMIAFCMMCFAQMLCVFQSSLEKPKKKNASSNLAQQQNQCTNSFMVWFTKFCAQISWVE